MFKLGAILMSICLVASLVLAATYKLTAAKIEEQSVLQEKNALKNILSQADEFKNKSVDGFNYYEGIKDNRLAGYVLKARAKGYGGNIDMLVGIEPSGAITGIEILSHQETPGLGARICEPWFLEQFIGKIAAKNLGMADIQAISGATISSKAVLEAVREDVKKFMDRI